MELQITLIFYISIIFYYLLSYIISYILLSLIFYTISYILYYLFFILSPIRHRPRQAEYRHAAALRTRRARTAAA
jgi:hypothetical protein